MHVSHEQQVEVVYNAYGKVTKTEWENRGQALE